MDLKSGDLIKDFLQDVNHFLADTLEKEVLSNNATIERQDLLRKLSYLSESAPPYIDMSRSTKCSNIVLSNVQPGEYVALNTKEESVESKLYEEFPKREQQYQYSLQQEQYQQTVSIEHLNLSASKLRVFGKHYGTLWRKEKFMGLFGERSIRCCAGLLGDVLYIYNNEKDSKPMSYINVQGFEARPTATYFPRDIRKRDCCFELVCPGKKSYQFLTCSVSDMEQWINCINEVSVQVTDGQEGDIFPKKKPLPYPPSKVKDGEEYDDIHGKNIEVEDKSKINGDEIYHNIKDLTLISEKSAIASLYQHSNSKILPQCDLVYDDIGANPSLYYNMTENSFECDKASKEGITNAFGYNDEDIYDDIGVVTSTSDVRCASGIETFCSNQSFAQKKDNLYEPVDNPRDE